MKTKALLFNICLLGVVFLAPLTGCRKTLETTGADDNQKSMYNLVIPDNFQWEMASTYTFLVSGKEGQVIEIKNANGSGLLHKSIIETGKTESVVSLRLPTYMTEVFINDQKVTLGPAILNVSIYSLKSALSSSNKAIDLDPNDSDALVMRAMAAGYLGDTQQMCRDFNAAAKLGSDAALQILNSDRLPCSRYSP